MTPSTDDAAHTLVSFGRVLRQNGVAPSPAQVVTFCKAVALLGTGDITDLYWSGRTCLISGFDEIRAYDAAFAAFFVGSEPELLTEDTDDQGSRLDSSGGTESAGERSSFAEDAGPAADEGDPDSDQDPEIGVTASIAEQLRLRSFSEWTEEETADMARAMAALEIRVPRRVTRRLRPSATAGYLDLRRTVQRSMKNEGEVLQRLWRRRVKRPRRLLLLVDVSGSMSAHSRAMLHLAYGLVASDVRAEVFCFGTRLTRITELLKGHDPDVAVKRASDEVVDWAGGTRIGESLATLLRDSGVRRHARGAVVLVASDGLEIGEPELMGSQTARLARLAHALVWMSPLKADPSYQPLTRGMRLALPHLDHLVAADSVSDLENMAHLIPRLFSTSSS